MTAVNTQIVEAFESCGMSPEDIATDQDLEITAVKAVLMQFSAQYRRMCKGEDEQASEYNFNEEQLRMATDTIAELAAYSEDERIRAKCAMYIRDDKKGRLDAVSKLTGLNINVFTINDRLKKAQEALQKAQAKAIPIQSEVVATA